MIVEKLAAAAGGEFDVKVLSRGSAQRFALPANVSVVTVDYSSLKSLTDALQGCYGVVDCLSGRSSLVTFEAVLDAAVAAGVDRYITLSHAHDPASRNEHSRLFEAQNHLGSKLVAAAEGGSFTFTALNSGPWIEYIMVLETMMSMPHRVFYMHEHPDSEISLSTRASLGDAVVATFQNASETKNKFLFIEKFTVSQNRALELAKEAMPDTEFQIIQANSQERHADRILPAPHRLPRQNIRRRRVAELPAAAPDLDAGDPLAVLPQAQGLVEVLRVHLRLDAQETAVRLKVCTKGGKPVVGHRLSL